MDNTRFGKWNRLREICPDPDEVIHIYGKTYIAERRTNKCAGCCFINGELKTNSGSLLLCEKENKKPYLRCDPTQIIYKEI